MIVSKSSLKKIKKIIDRKYKQITISVLGKSVFSASDLRIMQDAGIDISNDLSFLELTYIHNFLNNGVSEPKPKVVGEMLIQQATPGIMPQGEAHDYAIEHTNESVAQLLQKMKGDVSTRIESIVRETNNQYKANALQNLRRSDEADLLVKESMVSQIKQRLRDASGDATRNWTRIASTEISNAMGIGSVDSIVVKNQDTSLKEIYVFRIPVNDDRLCRWCRALYLDSDGSPRLYRLATLLSNGSNYGRKPNEWKAVITATHPNDRESQVIELPPGYKVLPGGKLTYVGLDSWRAYITEKHIE